MNKDSLLFKRAKFLIQLIPFISKEKCFALKGGTAINFFIREMPRLSVDIDLTYLPIEDRTNTFQNISLSLERIATSIKNFFKNKVHIREHKSHEDNKIITKLTILNVEDNFVKILVIIEPNFIIRGAVNAIQNISVSNKIKETFQLSASMQVLSVADVYGGKLCAALDRQHPRDLFDVKILLENEGISDDTRKAFIFYLISNDSPFYEILNPSKKEIYEVYKKEFIGMTEETVTYEALIQARENCISIIKNTLTMNEKLFLLSFKNISPDWSLIDIPKLSTFPSVKWKLLNLQKMKAEKRDLYAEKLKQVLNL